MLDVNHILYIRRYEKEEYFKITSSSFKRVIKNMVSQNNLLLSRFAFVFIVDRIVDFSIWIIDKEGIHINNINQINRIKYI